MAEYGAPAASPISLSHNPPREANNSGSDSDDPHRSALILVPKCRDDGETGPAGPSPVATPLTPTSGAIMTPPPSSVGPPSSSSSGPRKPRGRPPGSKNKPKPPVIVTQRDETAIHALILEVPSGTDVLEAVADFARRRRIGASVVGASGAVANVAVCHPHATAAGAATNTYTLLGRFDIVGLSGTFLPSLPAGGALGRPPFSVTLAGPQGMVYGGTVAGPLTAAGPVLVMVGSFGSTEFHRLPVSSPNSEGKAEEEDRVAGSGDGVEEEANVKPLSVSAPTTSAGVSVRYGPDPAIHSNIALPWAPAAVRTTPLPHLPLHQHQHHHSHQY